MDIEQLAKRQLSDYDRHQPGSLFAGYSIPMTVDDAYALSLTHDPASAVRSFVRAADRRFVLLCAPRAAILYFGTAPALGSRIASATGRPDPCR